MPSAGTNMADEPSSITATHLHELTLLGEIREPSTDLTAPLLLLKRLCSGWKSESSLSSSIVVPAKISKK